MFIAVHEDADGQPDGLATYRIKEHWTDSGLPQDKVVVEDLCGTTSEVEAVLWRLLLDVDLASTVVAFKRPVDDPIKWRLADPRRAQTNVVKDWLWLRVLDVPRALEGRGYEVTGQLVLDVHDPFRPSTGGRFLVDVDPKSATCARTDAEPDLALEIDDLGAIYLGGVAPSVLAAAGRIKARSAEVRGAGRRHLQDDPRAVLHDRVLSELPGCSAGPRGPERLDRGHGAPSHRTPHRIPTGPPAPPLPTVGAAVRWDGRWPGAPPDRLAGPGPT